MNPSQTQQIQDMFSKAATEHVGRVEAACAEAGRLESKGAEQARVLIDECARLARESMSYSMQLSDEWRKLAVEATRRTFEMMTPKG